jgi:anhydro-N-acetylmuramic acid kinase
LSGYYHHLMLSRLEKRGAHRPSLAVLNIGGMANISVSRAKAGRLSITAFDTGPGNSLSDTIMRLWGRRAVDRDGKLAARGTCGREVLRKMENHPYFRRRAPKSCGKEEFGSRFISQFYPAAPRSRSELCDRLATAAELVAWSIADSRRWLGKIGGLIVVGGGRHNVYIMRRISELISPVPLISCDCLGLPGDFCEAIGFALLAHETLSGRAGNLGGATSGKPAVLGKICVPA